MTKQTIKSTDEAWEDKALGAEEEFVSILDESLEAAIDEASATQLISIRLQKSAIEDLKIIASINNGIGYQTLIKQILKRFIECEKKRILRQYVMEKETQQAKTSEYEKPKAKARKNVA